MVNPQFIFGIEKFSSKLNFIARYGRFGPAAADKHIVPETLGLISTSLGVPSVLYFN